MRDADEVKAKADIVATISRYVSLKQAGRNFKGLCPFHKEKTPSFMVSPDRQAFYCFGCGKGGSVIDFIMQYHNLEFKEALADLAHELGITLSQDSKGVGDSRERLQALLQQAKEYYRYILLTHAVGKEARLYMKDRGITDALSETFGFGYSPNSWDGVTSYLKKKGYATEELIESGLTVASQRGGYDRFRGRLMFPLCDHRGGIVGFSGRLLSPTAKEAKYINSPETPLYSKSKHLFGLNVTKKNIQERGSVVIMEGEFDVISSYHIGISNVVGIKGTAVTEDQLRLLKRYTTKLVFALDHDIAGDAASRRGIQLAEQAGFEVYVAKLTSGKDPDEIARHSPHELTKAIEKARVVYDFYLDTLKDRFDLQSPYGKKQASEEIVPVLVDIQNSVLQAHYIKEAASLFGVTADTITQSINAYAKKKPISTSPALSPELANSSDIPSKDLYLVALACQDQQAIRFEELIATQILETIQNRALRELGHHMYNQLSKGKSFIQAEKSIPDELLSVYNMVCLVDVTNLADAADTTEWQQLVRRREIDRLKIELRTLMSKLEFDPTDELVNTKMKQLHERLRELEKKR